MGKGSGVAVSRGVGCRRGSDPFLLCLWCRLAAAALIGPLVWELAYATGMALRRQKFKTNKQTNKKKRKENLVFFRGRIE